MSFEYIQVLGGLWTSRLHQFLFGVGSYGLFVLDIFHVRLPNVGAWGSGWRDNFDLSRPKP